MIKPRARSAKPGAALLAWYDAHRRDLPWRAPPGQKADAYAVWLSEIMLQQTTVATVKSYYEKFLSRWPTIGALAAATLDDVLAEWAGLGYYARARNLHACAGLVARDHGGRFPQTEEALLRLPGIGPYTAAAVAAIVYDQPCVAVDGNVERVISRLYAIGSPPRLARPLIRDHARAMLTKARAGDFAQALMDLGATICTPRAPACIRCPLAAGCAARRAGAWENFPVKEVKRAKPLRRGAIFILQRGDAALLRRLPPKGLFGGMNVFPTTPFTQDVAPQDLRSYAPCEAPWRAIAAPVTHIFTHFSLEATVLVAQLPKRAPAPLGAFTRSAELDAQGLPTLMHKAALRAGLLKR